MNELRILTVRQPWAIIHGGKDAENMVAERRF